MSKQFESFQALSYDKETFRVRSHRVEGITITYGFEVPEQKWSLANDTMYFDEATQIIRDTPEARKLLGKLKKFDKQTIVLFKELEAKRCQERHALSDLIVYEQPNWPTD